MRLFFNNFLAVIFVLSSIKFGDTFFNDLDGLILGNFPLKIIFVSFICTIPLINTNYRKNWWDWKGYTGLVLSVVFFFIVLSNLDFLVSSYTAFILGVPIVTAFWGRDQNVGVLVKSIGSEWLVILPFYIFLLSAFLLIFEVFLIYFVFQGWLIGLSIGTTFALIINRFKHNSAWWIYTVLLAFLFTSTIVIENKKETLEFLEVLGWMFGGILVLFLLSRGSSSSNSQAIIDHMTQESSGQEPEKVHFETSDQWEFELQKRGTDLWLSYNRSTLETDQTITRKLDAMQRTNPDCRVRCLCNGKVVDLRP